MRLALAIKAERRGETCTSDIRIPVAINCKTDKNKYFKHIYNQNDLPGPCAEMPRDSERVG